MWRFSFIGLILFPVLTAAQVENNGQSQQTSLLFSGYLDGSYNYLVKNNKFISGVFDRAYDTETNGATLHQLSLTLGYQPLEGFGVLINPIVGYDPTIFAPYGWNPDLGSEQLAFDIPQAYIQYATEKLTLIGGELFTLASVESVNPTTDTNFSRSILWGYATPTTALGFRGTYVFNEMMTLIAGLNDGWDTIRDFSRRKTLELSLKYQPAPVFSLVVTGYSGGQRAADKTSEGVESIRNLVDVIATFNPIEKLTLIANYDYGVQPNAALPDERIAEAVWQGAAAYFNYQFNTKWFTSLRGEVFDDRNGYRTGVAQCWKEITFTLGFTPIKFFEVRAETRRDFSNVNSFLNSNGIGTSRNQQSFALEAFFTFS